MADANAQIVTVYRGEAAVIPFSPSTDTSVASKELAIYLTVEYGTTATLTFTESDGISVTAESTGDFTWTISRARTLALSRESYKWELWDLTASERLAGGTLNVLPSSRPTS